MDITVVLKVKVDLDAWQLEYGHANTAAALKEALDDIRHPDWYLQGQKWDGLGKVESVKAMVDLGQI